MPAFRECMVRIAPDIVFHLFDGTMPSEVEGALHYFPCELVRLRGSGLAEQLSGGGMRLAAGRLAHAVLPLIHQRPDGTNTSMLRVIRNDGPYAALLPVIEGLPQPDLLHFFMEHHSATWLRAPATFEELVRLQVVAAARWTPLTITVFGTRQTRTFSLGGDLLGPIGPNAFSAPNMWHVFLDDDSVSIRCAFWNAGRSGGERKLLIPLDAAISDPEVLFAAIKSVSELTPDVTFISSCSRDEAAQRLERLRHCPSGEGLSMRLVHGEFEYHVGHVSAAYGTSASASLRTDNEGALRFSPPVPEFAERDLLFGFDSEITLAQGNKLSLPPTRRMALALSNEAWRLDRWTSNDQGLRQIWLRAGLPVRPYSDGITGLATSENECVAYVHSAEVFLKQHLLDRNIELRPNQYTRYARGVERRFGGMDATLRLIRAGGSLIMKLLDEHRAASPGLKEQQLRELLATRFDGSRERAGEIMHAAFLPLVGAGLVRRGLRLECPHCDLTDWHSVDALAEWVECTGCAERFQLSGRTADWVYRSNELVRRFLHEGGHGVLTTASVLDALVGGHFLQLGGDFRSVGESTTFAEVDLLSLSVEGLWIAECKDYADLTVSQHVSEIEASLQSAIRTAGSVGATVIILGVTCEQSNQELFAMVQRAAVSLEPVQIAVHLVLNGDLHEDGEPEPNAAQFVSRSRLCYRTSLPAPAFVGSAVTSIGFGLSKPEVRPTIVDAWESELSEPSSKPPAPSC